jgi:glucan phosphoethanolaminetransferase (alkaline phosphatase superfamily)
METEANIIFVIASFGFAVILILSRERIPQAMGRSMALLSILLVLFAFFLIVYSFFRAGT